MIKIQIKNGDIDAALDRFKAAKSEQNRKFDEQLANVFAPKTSGEAAPKAAETPAAKPAKPAPSYQTLLSRSRRAG